MKGIPLTRIWILWFVCVLHCAAAPGSAMPWLTFEPSAETPADAPGRGRHIVLISGDEEYRSEEALPVLASILSERHGFRCTVLFSIDPATGTVDPDERGNIPGLFHLENADCMVLFTRFRNLPDEQMASLDAYLRSGRPVLGIRTATHAFDIPEGRRFARYGWRHGGEPDPQDPGAVVWKEGFGRSVLGETWIAHHGAHGAESTRGVVAPGAVDHPIARGLGAPGATLEGLEGIWGPSDVYRVRLPMAEGVEPIVLGQVLAGMSPDDPPLEGDKNEPMMPIVWTRPYRLPGGEAGMSATSTLGAATDLVAAGSRRMLINAVYWLCGLGESIPTGGTDARLIAPYSPSGFGFGGAKQGARPMAFAPPGSIAVPDRVESLPLRDGDRVVLIGGTFAEHLAKSGYFAAMVHAAHPDLNLSVRHIPWSADEVGNRPREMNVPGTMERLDELDATVVVACYGMSESFGGDAGLMRFESDLAEFLGGLTQTSFAPSGPPRVALVSPIAHADLGPPWVTGEACRSRNKFIADYASMMQTVARFMDVAFCDLFGEGLAASDPALTINGIHPSEEGCRAWSLEIGRSLGWIEQGASGHAATPQEREAAADYRRLAWDLFYHERLWYRPTNTEYVFGRRHEPFGIVNFPPEFEQLERMIDARDRALQGGPRPSLAALFVPRPTRGSGSPGVAAPIWETVPTSRDFPEDVWTPEPVVAKGTETSLGDLEIRSPEAFIEQFELADGYAAECFASEREFPEIANPLAMAFDEQHRLWLLCAQTYPHLLPGEMPRCKLVVLEDTDGDGAADTSRIFADNLYIPTGFAVDTDAVYLGQAPEFVRLADTDGDGVADRREVLLTGFAMPDSHHSISAFEWDPHGGILLHEGVFCVSGIETPWGTMRSRDAAVWRFDTRTHRLTRMAHVNFANPWGHAFDDYGQSILADASGGSNYAFSQVINGTEMDRRGRRGGQILNRGRPTAGCEILASRHFPDDVQGTFLVNQCIGFHGTRWNRLDEPDGEASAWSAGPMPQDLIASRDTNFRPVAMETGPDGALYLADWCNPIIGHMQYSVRDPRRDATHGRVWRIRHTSRGLLDPPPIPSGETPAERAQLLELLRLPEANTRHHARRRLQRAPAEAVLAEAERWYRDLAETDPLRERLALEMLWLHRAHGHVDTAALQRAAGSPDPRVRAGAIRIVRHWLSEGALRGDTAMEALARAADDDDMRVRLEAVVAAGFADSLDAIRVIEAASARPVDQALRVAISEAVIYLRRHGSVEADFVRRLELEAMPADTLVDLPPDDLRDRAVLVRADTPVTARLAAMERVMQADGLPSVIELVLNAHDPDAAAASVAALLPSVSQDAMRPARSEFASLAARRGDVGALGLAGLLCLDDESQAQAASADPELLARAAALLPAGTLPPAAIDALQATTPTGNLTYTSLADAILLHTTSDRVGTETRARVAARFRDDWAEPAATIPLARWGAAHEKATAGLRALALLDADVTDAPQDQQGVPADPVPVPLASDDQMALGEEIYHGESYGCVRCHGADGTGLEGFPPLANSPWVHGQPARAVRTVLWGLRGEITVDGQDYNSLMAPLGGLLDDEQVAAVTTYVRQSFGNFAAPVTPAYVGNVRGSWAPQGGVASVSGLLALHPLDRDTLVPDGDASPADAVNQHSPGNNRSWILVVTGIGLAILALLVGSRIAFGTKSP
jgi:putative membrane-bound dehydrogenase-like protein